MPPGQQELSLGVPTVPTKPKHQGPYTEGFERLWRLHPRGGKRGAFRCYLRLVPARVSQERAESALESYAGRLRNGFRGAHLSTWLNQEYWEQEPEASGNGPAGQRVKKGSAARWY